MKTSTLERHSQLPSWLEPVAAGVGIAAIAAIGGIVTGPVVQSEWYRNLEQPAFAPPSSLFAPVWTTLYALMVVAYLLVWRTGSEDRSWRVAFASQAGLNLLWSLLFFGARAPIGALLEIFVLLGFIIWTTILFWRRNKWAGILLLPYIAWVSFATVLNAAIVALNR